MLINNMLLRQLLQAIILVMYFIQTLLVARMIYSLVPSARPPKAFIQIMEYVYTLTTPFIVPFEKLVKKSVLLQQKRGFINITPMVAFAAINFIRNYLENSGLL